jgi:hypothetical protein
MRTTRTSRLLITGTVAFNWVRGERAIRLLATFFTIAGVCVASPARSAPDAGAGAVTDADRPTLSRRAQELANEARQAASPAPAAPPRPAKYLGHFTEAEVRAAAGESGADKREWRIAEWRRRPGSIVALSFRAKGGGAAGKDGDPQVAILHPEGGRLVRSATGSIVVGDNGCPHGGELDRGADRGPEADLDLGGYRLSGQDFAVGVRLTCHTTFPAGELTEARLYLLEQQGSTMRQIFEAPIAWTNHDRVAGQDSIAHGTVEIQPPSHGGHPDLLLRTNIRTEPFDGGSAKKRVELKRFLWDGTRYVTKDE